MATAQKGKTAERTGTSTTSPPKHAYSSSAASVQLYTMGLVYAHLDAPG